jgi:predicted Kef-type K+ transport protein
MKLTNTVFSWISMILLLISGLLITPTLPNFVVDQSFSYMVGALGMYTLMIVAPVVGIIQLRLLRKRALELSTRVATAYQQVESLKKA